MAKEMVGRANPSKTSRSKRGSVGSSYRIQTFVTCFDILPTKTEVRDEYIVVTFSAESLTDGSGKRADWTVPPHLRLANLPTYDEHQRMTLDPLPGLRADPKAVESFVQRYGVLRGRVSPDDMRAAVSERYGGKIPDVEPVPDVPLVYREDLAAFAAAQRMLRNAWAGDEIGVGEIGGESMEGFEIQPFHPKGIVLGTTELWKFVCFLFLHDYRAGKPARCANPDCLAPYFLKRRKTQKICEAGECVAWAQRKYALRWWRENRGKKQDTRGRRKEK